MEAREAVIVDTVRTAIGKRKGALAGLAPDRPARLRARSRCSSATTSTPARSTTSSAAASPSRGSRAATSPATRGSPPGCRWHVPATSGRPAVRLVAAGDALRGPGRDRRRVRPRDRVRRRVDDAGADVDATPAAGPGRSARRSSRHATTRSASSSGSRRSSPTASVSPARRWTRSRSRATGAPRRTPTTATSPRRSCPVPAQGRARSTMTGDVLGADEGIRPRHDARAAGRAAGRCGSPRSSRARHHRRQLLADERRRRGDAHRRPRHRRAAGPADPGPLRALRRRSPTTRCSCCRRRTR